MWCESEARFPGSVGEPDRKRERVNWLAAYQRARPLPSSLKVPLHHDADPLTPI